MSRTISRFLIGLFVFIGLLIVSIILFGVFSVRRSFPKIDGEVRLSALDGEVDIYRDQLGVPHIYASTPHDLFFAQGYVHAQDRFWQMDFWRHIGSGRLAEMFGSDQLETDMFLRTLGWAHIAQQEYEAMDANTQAIIDAYVAGVNAYLADHQGSELSLEYAVLNLINPDYEVEPWLPVHTMTWGKAMSWDLGGNMDSEIQRARLLDLFTPEQVADIDPPYAQDAPIIVPEPNTGVAASAKSQAVDRKNLTKEQLDILEIVAGRSEILETVLGKRGAGIGSNNWTISGVLTATGLPILADDTHLSEQMPSIWYENGLHCVPVGADCPFNVVGFSFASAPGVVIGHNDRIAWGVTNVGPDVQDLFIEKLNPDNPNQYEFNGEWLDMTLMEETFQIAGGEPVDITVRYTRHGPIVSDVYGDLEDFREVSDLDIPENYAVALQWAALEPGTLYQAILKLDTAQDWEQFREGAALFSSPSQNLVYADVDGNIGYQTPGMIPIRSSGDGSLPVPGWTADYDWTGYIPFEELPFAYNPPQGYIVTANNRVAGDEYPYLISKEWDHGYRARRIVDMIENSPGPIDVAYVQRMHGDNKNLNAENLVPLLMQVPLQDPHAQDVRQLLVGWDYQQPMDSPQAALFETFWASLLKEAFQDELPEDMWPEGSSRWYQVVENLVEEPDNYWWDNKTTPEIETRDDIFRSAFIIAVDWLEQLQGEDPQKWNWGDLHTITFHNQSLGKSGVSIIESVFNRGEYRTAGGAGIVNATGWDADESYQVDHVPSQRMIVDLNNLANSFMIHTTGQSGHAYHPHYADMVDYWRNIEYYPMFWDREAIEADAEGHLILLP